MNGNDTEIDDFETRLRGELRRRADELVLQTVSPRFVPQYPRPQRRVSGVVVACAVVAIALVAAGLTRQVATTSSTHVRTQPGVLPTAPIDQGALVHFTITQSGTRLRGAQNLAASASTPSSDPTFAAVTYRMPGELRPPLVHAVLARAKDQPLPSDPLHHPQYRALDVGGRSGEIVWLGQDIADLVVAVDGTHTLELSSWGLTQAELVHAAARAVVHSDTSFALPGLPAGLRAGDAAPALVREGARAEFAADDRTVVISGYSGGFESFLGGLLYAGSGTELGATTIEQILIDGRPGLLRIDRLEAGKGATGHPPLTFEAVWEPRLSQTGELTGGATSRADIAGVLRAVARIDDQTWQAMVTRCPWSSGRPTDTATNC